jgi:hypothetical protein
VASGARRAGQPAGRSSGQPASSASAIKVAEVRATKRGAAPGSPSPSPLCHPGPRCFAASRRSPAFRSLPPQGPGELHGSTPTPTPPHKGEGDSAQLPPVAPGRKRRQSESLHAPLPLVGRGRGGGIAGGTLRRFPSAIAPPQGGDHPR